jgi:hypothetical protein
LTNDQYFNQQIIASIPSATLFSGSGLNNGNKIFNQSIIHDAALSGFIQFITPNKPIQFQWSDGINSESRTNLSKGTYDLTVSSNGGCNKTVSVSLTDPAPFNITSNTSSEIDSTQNGSISIIANGGKPPYFYFWPDLQQNGSTVDNLVSGVYSVLIVDANGCPAYDTIKVERIITPIPDNYDLIVQPNPTSDIIKVGKIITGMDVCRLKIYDVTGRIIRNESTSMLDLIISGISLRNLADGIYTLSVEDGTRFASTKVAVTK